MNLPLKEDILTLAEKHLLKYLAVVSTGLIGAIETSISFMPFCLILILVDMWSAINLNKRVAKKYPNDITKEGKFRSNPGMKVIWTFIKVFICIILGNYVDILVLINDDKFAVRTVIFIFGFIQLWSIFENWSSENDGRFKWLAIQMQKIMVNKAERYLNVTLDEARKRLNYDNTNKELEDSNDVIDNNNNNINGGDNSLSKE